MGSAKLKKTRTEFLVDISENEGNFTAAISYMELETQGSDLDQVLMELSRKVQDRTGLAPEESYFILNQGKELQPKELVWTPPDRNHDVLVLAEQVRESMESFQGFYAHGSLDTHDSMVILSQSIHQLAVAIEKLAAN